MAATEPTIMSGGQGGSNNEVKDAVEMTKIEPVQPGVPAKDTPAAQDLEASAAQSTKGKEREVMERTDSLSIGAASEAHAAAAAADPADGPVCNITLLLPTGARHPYKIDDRYLAKRNVDVQEITEHGKKDPFSISVYKLKELILREWRDEWDGKPASPSSIRLIHFGKLLDDKEQLKSESCSTPATQWEVLHDKATNALLSSRIPIQCRSTECRPHVCQAGRNDGGG